MTFCLLEDENVILVLQNASMRHSAMMGGLGRVSNSELQHVCSGRQEPHRRASQHELWRFDFLECLSY